MVPAIKHHIAPDFVLHVTSAVDSLPLQGTFNGQQGLQEFLNLFFGTFSRVTNSLTPLYAVGTDFVVARYSVMLHTSNQTDEAVQVYRHFHFRDGLLSRIDDLYESVVTSE